MSAYTKVRIALFVLAIGFAICLFVLLTQQNMLVGFGTFAFFIGLGAVLRLSIVCPKCGMQMIGYMTFNPPSHGLMLDDSCPYCGYDLRTSSR